MTETSFAQAVTACLLWGAADRSSAHEGRVRAVVEQVLGDNADPDRAQLQARLDQIHAVLPEDQAQIALVMGGATKIKGYVFESPKLPEIRGASALLDWVNEDAVPQLWAGRLGEELGQACVIYASGGGFLAFAPAALGEELAAAAERCYTTTTLTANSVFVTHTVHLLELRYGQLAIRDGAIAFWVEEFLQQWSQNELQKRLATYYYAQPADPVDAPEQRFFRRKTFGELVTLLATMTTRRREERSFGGDTRSIPHYPILPWAEKCDSSDLRPAVWSGMVVDEERKLSEPSARKRYVGQLLKRDAAHTRWYTDTFAWRAPDALAERSWEAQWRAFVQNPAHVSAQLAQHPQAQRATAASDVQEIAQASRPDGFIGVIYADGNNVGRLIATLTTPARYQAVSATLSAAAKTAVFHALGRHVVPIEIDDLRSATPGQKKWVYPFEILTIGGDDLFIIVPGSKALEIAEAISASFEQCIAERLRAIGDLNGPSAITDDLYSHRSKAASAHEPFEPLVGLSAGVIIAPETTPIFFLRDLVEELLKSAKKKAKQHTAHGFYGGAVDFMVLKSISMVTDNIQSFRRQALGMGGDRRLTARPYTWREFSALITTVRALQDEQVPRSQLYRLRRMLDEQPGETIVTSVMEYFYTCARNERMAGVLKTHVQERWCESLPPWRAVEAGAWETIWADMLEIYDMVKDQQ
ncbi:hydrolase [Chloroflexia bacterium SDU3-3]|nr:hydrolase [Chloroflexia bacterium SDU3-3]